MADVVPIDSKERTLETIRNEYMQLCADVGNIEYVIRQHNSLLTEKYKKMNDLNREGFELSKQNVAEVPSAS